MSVLESGGPYELGGGLWVHVSEYKIMEPILWKIPSN